MEFSIFDGEDDPYWWILCTEKYFRERGTSGASKMIVAALAMRGHALKWWLWWSHRHPKASWDLFTTSLLWRFKPEWRHLLPVLDEEPEEACESTNSAVKLSRVDDCVVDLVTDVAGEHDLNSPPCSKLVEKSAITLDSVDSVATTIADEQNLDFPLQSKVQIVQLEIADSISRIQQSSVIVPPGDKKFSNPSLGPQSPKPPEEPPPESKLQLTQNPTAFITSPEKSMSINNSVGEENHTDSPPTPSVPPSHSQPPPPITLPPPKPPDPCFTTISPEPPNTVTYLPLPSPKSVSITENVQPSTEHTLSLTTFPPPRVLPPRSPGTIAISLPQLSTMGLFFPRSSSMFDLPPPKPPDLTSPVFAKQPPSIGLISVTMVKRFSTGLPIDEAISTLVIAMVSDSLHIVVLRVNPPPPPEPPDWRCCIMAAEVISIPEFAMEVRNYSEILTSMINCFAEIGRHVKGYQWKSGVARDSHCWVCQIKVYAQFGYLNSAHQLFAEMLKQGLPKLPHRPPVKPPHRRRCCELDDLLVDWVQFRFCRKSYGHSSYFLSLLHYTCYCVHFLHKNATGGSYCGFHVLKIRKGVRYYWLGYVRGKWFEKGKYCSICWKVYKDLETKTIASCDIYHVAFPTFRSKLEFECAGVTMFYEDYKYCIYLILELLDYAILHIMICYFQNQIMIFSLDFNPITTIFSQSLFKLIHNKELVVMKWHKAFRIGNVWLTITSDVAEFLRHSNFRDYDMLVMSLLDIGKHTNMPISINFSRAMVDRVDDVNGVKGSSYIYVSPDTSLTYYSLVQTVICFILPQKLGHVGAALSIAISCWLVVVRLTIDKQTYIAWTIYRSSVFNKHYLSCVISMDELLWVLDHLLTVPSPEYYNPPKLVKKVDLAHPLLFAKAAIVPFAFVVNGVRYFAHNYLHSKVFNKDACLNIFIGSLKGQCVFALVSTGLVMKTGLKDQCELISTFSICKHEVKLSLVATLVVLFETDQSMEGDHDEVLTNMGQLVTRSYLESLDSWWDLATVCTILHIRNLFCYTNAGIVYLGVNNQECVNIWQQPLIPQLQTWTAETLGHLDVLTRDRSSQFKQWDPGKFIHSHNFYNLEDKVGLDGVGIDTSKDMSYIEVGLEIESDKIGRPKRIILYLRSGMTMMSFSSESLVLED